LLVYVFGISLAFGDTLIFSNGRALSGTVIQTNGDDLLVLTSHASFNFSKTSIKEIKTEPTEAVESSNASRLPDFKKAVFFLSKQSWAAKLTPIPATVVDKGILRNVPYTSFRCGGDYEVNIYGDLENPSGIEIGMYHKLLDDASASSGDLISNAEVVRVIDGVSLVWRNGPTSGGMVKLADLPEDLRIRFGYDPVKTQAADKLEKENREHWHQEAQVAAQAAQVSQAAAAQYTPSSYFSPGYSDYSSGDYSGGGSVYVHGYFRSNGTYVNAYTRSSPHRR